MNAEPIKMATIKKWEAIACDRLNHALIAYTRNDGLFVVDVFEVLRVLENKDGILCLRASSLSEKFHGSDSVEYTAMSADDAPSDNVVDIPLSSIVESHRYRFGTGLNDIDIRRYYESVAKVRQRKNIQTISRSVGESMRFPELTKSNDHDSSVAFNPWMGCAVWLLYAAALIGFARWIF